MATLIINIRLFKPFVNFFSTRQHNNKSYHNNKYKTVLSHTLSLQTLGNQKLWGWGGF
jgi:hypothetical protein